MHNKASETGYTTPYKFTGKELDPETGLYYYGARYYDPVISRWVSTDPPMMTGEYFPTEELWKKEAEEKQQLTVNYPFKNDFLENHPNVATTAHLELPGIGGVYNTINLDAYQYAGNNPVRYIDPDGNFLWMTGCSRSSNERDKLINSFFKIAQDSGVQLDSQSKSMIMKMGSRIDAADKLQTALFLAPFVKALPGLSPSGTELSTIIDLARHEYGVAAQAIGGSSNILKRRLMGDALDMIRKYDQAGVDPNPELRVFWESVLSNIEP